MRADPEPWDIHRSVSRTGSSRLVGSPCRGARLEASPNPGTAWPDWVRGGAKAGWLCWTPDEAGYGCAARAEDRRGSRALREGEAAKRGLVARLPSGQRLLGDADTWLAADVHDLVRSTRLDRNGADAASLFVDLHPAAFPMRLHASGAGAVDAMAVTSAVGPGYHTYVHRLIQRIGDGDGGHLGDP